MTASKYEDPTPTTWDWLESLGWNYRDLTRIGFGAYEIDRSLILWQSVRGLLCSVHTRGRVRMAATLFGIDLKEAGE